MFSGGERRGEPERDRENHATFNPKASMPSSHAGGPQDGWQTKGPSEDRG